MKALTGLSWQEFTDLVPVFEKAYIADKMSDPKRRRKVGGGLKGSLPTYEDKLFFTPFYYKTYPTFDVLGFLFNKSRGRSCEAIHFFTKIAEKALGHALVLPERQIHSVEDFLEKFPEVKDLFVDGTESRMERPKNSKRNRRMYSGKKKAHTRKRVLAADGSRRIRILSATRPGRRHDKAVADAHLVAERTPQTVGLWGDSGFQGLDKKHPNVHVVKRGTKRRPLTESEREENRFISSVRIVVEHAIAGMKRYGVVHQVLRNKIGIFDDRVARVCAGLWNWHLNYVTA